MKPKIAILTIRNNYSYGGVHSTLKVVHDFCSRYFDPTVFYLSFDKQLSARLKGLKTSSSNRLTTFDDMKAVEIGSRWSFWEPGHYAFTLNQWQEALKNYDYFFVVSATPLAAHPLVLMNKKFPMLVATSYDDDRSERVKRLNGLRFLIDRAANSSMKKIEKKILYDAPYIFAMSTYAKGSFTTILHPKKKKISICGYPIETTQTKKKLDNKILSLVAVGRFSDPRKNFPMLIRVFAALRKKMPHLRLTIVGQKPQPSLIEQYEDLYSLNNIHFTGPLPSEKLKEVYQRSTLMLITSYQEGLGIVGLEALSYGIPIVATDCGGVRDFVIKEKTGYIVPINHDEAMVKKTLKLLQDEELYTSMQTTINSFLNKHYSQEKIYKHFQEGLENVYPELQKHFLKK